MNEGHRSYYNTSFLYVIILLVPRWYWYQLPVQVILSASCSSSESDDSSFLSLLQLQQMQDARDCTSAHKLRSNSAIAFFWLCLDRNTLQLTVMLGWVINFKCLAVFSEWTTGQPRQINTFFMEATQEGVWNMGIPTLEHIVRKTRKEETGRGGDGRYVRGRRGGGEEASQGWRREGMGDAVKQGRTKRESARAMARSETRFN